MKFTCTRENFFKGIIQVQGISVAATTLPILKNVLLDASGGVLKLKSTNLEIGMNAHIRGKVEEEGQITVDARLLHNFINLLPQEKLSLYTEEKRLIIESGAYSTKINGLAAEDFPVIPEVKRVQGIGFPSRLLKQGLYAIMSSISSDDARPELHGAYLAIDKQTITLAGTDSYRLAETKIEGISNNGVDRSFIIPLRAVKELARELGEEETVTLFIEENLVIFSYSSTEMFTRLVDGKYPEYGQIVPKSYVYRFVVPKDDFMNAVKISGLFATAGTYNVTMELKPKNKEIAISSATTIGEERTVLSLPFEGEENMKVVFDYRYLLDGLSSINAQDVVFEMISSSAPVLLKPKDEQEKFLYIVMPIRQ
jgi:DNA polymerase-3 subunit beta